MARRIFTRREVSGLAGAMALVGGPATSAIVGLGGAASRLTPRDQQPYLPPASLSTVLDIYRRMTVPIRIGDRGPFAFVVDTGANQSVISEELASELGLPRNPPALLNGVAGVRMAPTTTATLRIAGRVTPDVPLSILPAEAIGGAGMLGLDRLEGQRLTLDFRGRNMRIDPPGRLWRDPSEIAVKAHRRDGQLTLVDADLAGIRIVAFLDSGAQNTLGNRALQTLAFARHPTRTWLATAIVSATGQSIEAQMADLPSLRIGGMRLPNWPVAFADLHTFQMWNLADTPAIMIGVDVLSRFEQVCLDFARDEVRFRPPNADQVSIARR